MVRVIDGLMAVIGLCHVSSHALVQTVIQSYSPPEFRGRAIAIFHMNQVLLLVGGMLVGAFSAVLGAPWAASAMAIVGTLCMVAIFVTVPRARDIRLASRCRQWRVVAIDLGVMGGDFDDSRWPGFADRDVSDRCAARLIQALRLSG